jgi:hypothetical protein
MIELINDLNVEVQVHEGVTDTNQTYNSSTVDTSRIAAAHHHEAIVAAAAGCTYQ